MGSNKKNLIIVNRRQFGYWTDYYYFSKYLSRKYNVHYICYDEGLDKIDNEDIQIKYLNKKFENNYLELFHFIFSIFFYAINVPKKIVFINYFSYVFIARFLLPFSKLVMDIRTTSITTNENERRKDHSMLRFSSWFFNYTTILSHSLMKELRLNSNKTAIIPVGAEEISITQKKYGQIRLIYVGILTQRNIHETIEGLHIFLERNQKYINKITYDIVGFGSCFYENKLMEAITDFQLNNVVFFHGRKTIEESKKFWEKSNVGVVYVPKIPAYENQPPTKLFESFFYGIPVIATNTNENTLFVNEYNGVLINDNPISFAEGLEKLVNNVNKYDSHQIKNSVAQYSWKNIFEKLSNIFFNL